RRTLDLCASTVDIFEGDLGKIRGNAPVARLRDRPVRASLPLFRHCGWCTLTALGGAALLSRWAAYVFVPLDSRRLGVLLLYGILLRNSRLEKRAASLASERNHGDTGRASVYRLLEPRPLGE